MRVSIATDPASPERANEDFAAASHNVAVVLDGAGNPAASDEGCIHGVAWYARHLGTALLHAATDDTDQPLTSALRKAILAVAALHSSTCNLEHPGSPSATVIVARILNGRFEYLVLADSVLVLQSENGTTVVTDDREARIGAQYRAAMDAAPNGTGAHARELRRYMTAMRAHRNRAGGFWVASVDPGAADEAVSGSIPLHSLRFALILSDGASRAADRFGIAAWPELVELANANGPAAIIEQVRTAEASDPHGARWPRGKARDDATAVLLSCTAERS